MADNKLTKSVGEHWACAVLAGLGWSPALTRDGVARTDILAVNSSTGRMVEIQVKTASYSKRINWIVGTKGCVPAHSRGEWYILVGLGPQPWDAPTGWVVPRDHVAAATWIRRQEWLTNPNVSVGKRNTPIASARIDDFLFRRYRNRWDLLEMDTSDVPVMLPPKFRTWAQEERVGLRSDHPWVDALPAWDDTDEDPDAWVSWLA